MTILPSDAHPPNDYGGRSMTSRRIDLPDFARLSLAAVVRKSFPEEERRRAMWCIARTRA
jgi:hypothetical protein